MLSKLEHPLKAEVPIFVTLSGIEIDLILEQFSNAYESIINNPFGKLILAKLVHPWKAE